MGYNSHARSLSFKIMLILGSVAMAVIGYQVTSPSAISQVRTSLGARTSDLQLTLNPDNNEMVDQVRFHISPADVVSVKARLSLDGAWYDCDNFGGEVNCDTTSPPARADNANHLSVIVS